MFHSSNSFKKTVSYYNQRNHQPIIEEKIASLNRADVSSNMTVTTNLNATFHKENSFAVTQSIKGGVLASHGTQNIQED